MDISLAGSWRAPISWVSSVPAAELISDYTIRCILVPFLCEPYFLTREIAASCDYWKIQCFSTKNYTNSKFNVSPNELIKFNNPRSSKTYKNALIIKVIRVRTTTWLLLCSVQKTFINVPWFLNCCKADTHRFETSEEPHIVTGPWNSSIHIWILFLIVITFVGFYALNVEKLDSQTNRSVSRLDHEKDSYWLNLKSHNESLRKRSIFLNGIKEIT